MKKGLLFAAMATAMVFSSCKKEEDPVTTTTTIKLTPSQDATIYRTDSGADLVDSTYGAGGGDLLRVGSIGDGGLLVRTLIQFDVSSIPSNATIDNAQLIMSIANVGTDVQDYPIFVNRLTTAWTEGTSEDNCNSYCPGDATGNGDVTWMQPSVDGTTYWTTPGGDFEAMATDSSSNPISSHTTFSNLASDVQAWVNGTANNGWILKIADEAITSAPWSAQIRYHSNEGGAGIGGKPRLVITYSVTE